MRKLISNLASLKITVVLVLLLGVVLAWGTILESLRGTEAARAVYYAPWFFALQGLFALNVLCALIDRWPQNRWRVGFAITHVSMLVILLGSLTTALLKVEGQIALWEGEESSTLFQRGANGSARRLPLPVTVRLEAFELETYPGTRQPAQFRSIVQVREGAAGAPRKAVIEMNRPLSAGGYGFFQSSYRMEQGRKASILSVSRDPGQPIVFLGYVGLVAGMIVVFATRLIQAKQTPVAPMAAGLPSLPVLALVLAVLAAAAPARAVQVPDADTVKKLKSLPVQHDGRTMPFDTQAREAVRTVTGRASWSQMDAVAMVAGWEFDPDGWQHAPIVKVGGNAVAALVGLPPGTRYASLSQLLSSQNLIPAIESAHAREQNEQKLSPVEKDLLKLEERLTVLYGYFKGTAINPIPVADPKGTWLAVPRVPTAADLAGIPDTIRKTGAPPHYSSEKDMAREISYNATRPTRLSWILLLPAAIAAGLTVASDRFRLRLIGAILLVAGFAVMTWGLATRWQIAGRIPASNMYESMLFLGWGVGLFGVVALALRQRLLVANAAGLGALAMMLADLLPVDPFIHPIVPVLSGTPWLAIHVPIIVVSYSVLAMATGIAHLVIGVEIFAPARRDLSARWSELLYYYLHVGSILLIAGILTGSIWAASSWGRYWGWDPKEVWSLIAFLAYMAILHARSDEQIRTFGVAAASIGAFWTILMTYLGVNFVLAAGLHSYGFGSSNLVGIMALIALVEIVFLAAGWLAHRRRGKLSLLASAT
jgi:cytochrome c-type biogenesis protein CcsB